MKAEPSEALLHLLTAPPVRAPASKAAAPVPAGKDSAAAVTLSPRRMLAIQHALSDFGYGQLKPTGVDDAETKAAIEKFQHDRGLPVDGKVTDAFVHALAVMTGRRLN
jgi:peptidoglycan hydrolase-like protein with peptidoglycan-binding domain